ncbi:MAG: BppU family phage baseplate upper protein [Turicibacter sp.]|nr:BppU family phage baseplate upper protein [Turicibacter sp.]
MEFYEISNPIADNFVIDVDQGVIGGKVNKVIQQGEHDARHLQVELVQNGVPVDLTNCDVYFLTRPAKSKDTPTMTACEIFNEEQGHVKIAIKNYMTINDGIIECEFVRIGHDKTVLPFKKFNLTVDGSIYTSDTIESSEPLHALVDALATVREVEQYLGSEFMDLEAKYAGELSETKNQVLLSKKELNDKINEEIEKTNTQLSQIENEIRNNTIGEKSGLSGWLRSFEFDRNKKIVFIGDSTTDGQAGVAQFLYQELNNYHVNSGDKLDGVTIVDKGSSGNTCYNFIRDESGSKGIKACVDEQADLYVFCYGINDVRLGNTTKEQLKEYITIAINRLLKETNAYILLRIPNSLLSDDPSGNNWIQPLEKAQEYTDIMWEAYQELKNKWSRVDILDMQDLIFGRKCKTKADNPFMNDNLHPNSEGMFRIARLISDYIGLKPTIRYDLVKLAQSENPEKPYLVYPKILETNDYELVCEGYFVAIGSNYLDFNVKYSVAKNLIKKGDIIKVGDELAYDFDKGELYASGNNTRFAGGVSFSNYENAKRGIVGIYRKKGVTSFSVVFNGAEINQKVLGVFSCSGVVNKISLTTTKPIPSTMTFKLIESNQNSEKEIATMSFAINNMDATTIFDNENANDGSYLFKNNAVYLLKCESTAFSGDVLLNMILSN